MKKMSKSMLMTALICGVVYLGGNPVYASELQEFSLDEYVVTAARTETKLVDTPANISVVDAQTIEERHYQDVSEVLKDVPGANVIDTGKGSDEKKIMLNGDERVLIMVDGRRLNFDMGTMSRSGYDMNQLPDVGLIERIEVLKGAGGALYGSDAVGGVVNIITKKADRNFGKVSMGFGSFGEKDYSAVYSIKEGKTGVNVAASRNEKDYYKYRDAKTDTTKRWVADSEYKNEKVSLGVTQELTETTNLEIGYDYSKMEGFNPTDTITEYTNSVDKKTENIYVKYDWILNEQDNGFIQYYHNEYSYKNLSVYSDDPYFTVGFLNEKSNGVDLQQEITVSDTNKVVVGASWRKSDVNTKGDNTYDESIDNMALFINDTWEFAPSWTLNAGVRYDDHSEAGDETTLSTGLNKKFDDNSHAYINWGQVFRAPTTDDLFYYSSFTARDYATDEIYTGYMYGNPNLKPETGDTWTIGYQTRLNEKTDLGISYFKSDLEDAINWGSDGRNYRVSNVDKQKKRGMELTLNHKLNDNVNLEASYTYLRVKNNEGMGYYRDTNYIPNMYRLGLRYHDGKWSADAFLRYGTGASTVYNANKYNVPYIDGSFVTVDMAVTYKATKDLSFYAKGYNLFNEAYADQAGAYNGSYSYPAQSRRFIVGAEYKF